MAISIGISGIPLYAITGSVVGLFLLLLIYYIILKRRVDNIDSPEYQVAELKKKTSDFGVSYKELVFGKLIGKGSQGEVFKATWR